MSLLLPSIRYPALFNSILKQAQFIAAKVASEGIILPPEKWSLARDVGINHPYKIFILKEKIAFFHNKLLYKIAKKIGINQDMSAGLAVGYSIVIAPECYDNDFILAHELRHVAQFLACGDLALYLDYYLMELLHFGYGHGPLENDAQLISQSTIFGNDL